MSPLAQLVLSLPEVKSVTMTPNSFIVMKKVVERSRCEE